MGKTAKEKRAEQRRKECGTGYEDSFKLQDEQRNKIFNIEKIHPIKGGMGIPSGRNKKKHTFSFFDGV